MCAQTLRSYFETALQQRRALDAVVREGWLVPSENLDLYEASQYAFDPLSSEVEAFRDFEEIYDELKGPNWQVFRPSSPERDCWPPRQVFDTIKREFPEFSWGCGVNLLTLTKSGTRSRLESCLAKMQGIKPKKGYPHMTVSKFLHFYNPGLFPIYDNKVIWGKVFKRFAKDFRVFCLSMDIPYDRAINDDTAAFLLYYMDWASSLLSFAHRGFMQVFVDWLGKQQGTHLHRRRFDPTSLYATAFEITVIGATEASQVARITKEARKHAPNLREVVLEVGAEGGSIKLLRERKAGGDWQFQMKTNETALYDLLSEEDRNEIGECFAQTGYVHSFREALGLLDSYPWFSLSPLKVHPEFLNAVLLEVRKRGGPTEETRWREELKHG